MQEAQVVITGTAPLLMHRYPMEPIEALEKRSAKEQAEISAYRHPETGELYVPGVAIQRALIGAATFSKGKGRSTLQKVAAACLFVSPEYALLGTKDFIIDSRPVVIAATKGRVVRHRARLDHWSVTVKLEWDDTLLTENQVRRIVDDCGSRVGLLEFRPERKGPYGRFVVTSWKN